MRKIKDKIAALLLFAIAIIWGNIWTTEFLSCPEWWFAGVNALLFGVGIYIADMLPGQWRTAISGWLLAIVSLIGLPVLSSALLPFAAGVWYGSNAKLYRSWQISRTFCAGLLIGGIFAGIINIPQILPVLLALLVMLQSGLQGTWLHFCEMVLLACFYLWGQPAEHPELPPPEKFDPGTVITAFAMVQKAPGDSAAPRVVFVGGNGESLYNTGHVLSPAAEMVFLPELPGTVTPGSDLIVVSRLPEIGTGGAASLARSLAPGGVLVMPLEYCRELPAESWYILPGSEGRYAAMTPGGEVELDPDKLDANFVRRYPQQMENAPLGGALAGMLVDYEAHKLTFSIPAGKSFFRFLYYAMGAGGFLLIIWLLRLKKGGRDNLRILLNCAGFILLTAFLMPIGLSGLPVIPAVTALLLIISLIWIFRRPVRWSSSAAPAAAPGKLIPHRNFRLVFSGLVSLLALFFSFGSSWIAAVAALISGGYFFAELDAELCSKRDISTEPVRFLGFALGAFAANYMQNTGVPFWGFFLTVVLLRGWSFFRS